jgi:hypothetical protein
VGLVVRGALGLIKGRLGIRLGVVGLDTTDNAVGSIADGLRDLLLGRLGGVRSNLLLGLCGVVSNRQQRKRGSTYW